MSLEAVASLVFNAGDEHVLRPFNLKVARQLSFVQSLGFETPASPIAPPANEQRLMHPEARLTPPKVGAFLDFAALRLRRRLESIQV